MLEHYRRQLGWAVRSQVDQLTRKGIDAAFAWGKSEVERRFMASVTIDENDEAFRWLNVWLAAQPQLQDARRATVSTIEPYEEEDEYLSQADRKRRAEMVLAPGQGTHRLRYKGSIVWITRSKDKEAPKREHFEVRMIARDSRLLKQLLSEARNKALDTEEDGQIRVMAANGSYWRHAAVQPARKPGSVLLPGDEFERLELDLKRFLARKARYSALGIPFRRGYLFHGMPGTGKTSTIMALASRFDLHLHMLNLSSPLIDDAALVELLANVKEGSAVLMEDVDALWASRRKRKDNESSVSFSGLLNALDGVAAGQGRIVFMTTNHLEQLDPALTRPGRVDYRIEFGPANHSQALRLYRRFYEEEGDESLAASFAADAADGLTPMCDLQEYLLGYFDDPHGAARDIAAYLPEARRQREKEAAGRRRAARAVEKKLEDQAAEAALVPEYMLGDLGAIF